MSNELFPNELLQLSPEFLPAVQDTDTEGTAPQLLTQSQMLDPASKLPNWLAVVYAEFRRHVLDPNYPCYFAVAGEQKGTLRYSYVNDLNSGISTDALKELIQLSRLHPQKRHALAVFIKPESRLQSHDWYIRCGWDLLQKLHDADTTPWPSQFPTSPADPHWEFCFQNEPLFVFGALPSHHRRRSRNLGPAMVLLFQPRSVFNGIEGGSPAGTRARQIIRKRLANWDLAELHPSMGDYGDPSNFEASQYFIPDDHQPSPPCPLVIRSPQTPATANATHTPEAAVPSVTVSAPVPLEQAVRQLLPNRGHIEIQRDPPGTLHPLHQHPVDETLYVAEGDLFLHANHTTHHAPPGSIIQLPANSPHSSTAGPTGCIYLIATHPRGERNAWKW